MMEGIVVIFVLLCIAQFTIICHTRKQLKNWLDVLRSIKQGRREKIFAKNQGLMADIAYELNMIVEDNKAQIALLKKADEANKQILTSMSHDVRTPLASLLGYLEALNKGLSNLNDEKEYIAVAYRKANDLKLFIDMLFEWFKLNSKEQQYHIESADINEITREVLIEWLPVFEQSEIILAAHIDGELFVELDKTAYKRVLNNLIQNAVNHGECRNLKISVNHCSDSVSINVANDGRNIPAQHLPHIFERMYKGETSRSNKGSGLGLTITKELVTALNGKISVSSTQGNDTIFTIMLPV